MAISAGDLNRRITIERDFPTRDGHGNDVHNWQPIAKMWAAYTPGSGTERRQAAQDRGAITAVFSVRKTATLWPLVGPRVDPNCRLVFQGLAWDIHSIALVDLDGLDITATTAYQIIVRPLVGAIVAQALVAGNLTVRAPLAGSVLGTGLAAGVLTVTAPLAGAVAGAGTVSGTLTVVVPLAGAVAGASFVGAALTVTAPLAGAVAGTAMASGTLTVLAPLAGAIRGIGAAVGALTVTAPLAGAVAGSSAVAGTLTIAYGYTNSEAAAVAARMTNPPSNALAAQMDTLVGALKNGATSSTNIWALLDGLVIFRMPDQQSGGLNWKGGAATFNGTGTFTANQGWQGDGTTGSVDSGFNPSTAGGNWTLNSAHMGFWSRTNVYSGSSSIMNVTGQTKIATGGASISGALMGINQTLPPSASSTVFAAGGDGHFVVSRTGATQENGYRNATDLSTGSKTSTAIPNANVALPVNAANLQFGAMHWGAGLTAAQVTDLYNALNAFGVGA